ncbi:hypothetical protein BBK82_33280 [Lentzea guizhouensis]|uniref:Uncharacterized protein n=1 Tax=Lentzea guizhouensis TaxID=1586287 RepID=A0A1B2HR68_9PSEU|nr:hypothetical protein [Lentzea guizhouensis]ANZ40182.1 hypothetical protein BBK82_33280 [Lentzea guizhouensis]
MIRRLVPLALALWFTLHRRTDPSTPGTGGRPPQRQGSVDAGAGVRSAQERTGEIAERGRSGQAGSNDVTLPSDARPWRQRDIPRILEAEQVRNDIRPGIQRAVDDAAAEFHARPADQRYTGDRAATVDAARDRAEALTEQRQREAAEVAAGRGDPAELERLRAEESNAWRNLNTTRAREAGSEIHAIFARNIEDRHQAILGNHAGDYRLRTEAPYDIDGRAAYPGTRRPDLVLERVTPEGQQQYTAHVYDLKTGQKGIEADWEFRVERYARGLFKPEELRPTP